MVKEVMHEYSVLIWVEETLNKSLEVDQLAWSIQMF